MKKMKKLLSLFVVMTMMLSVFTACDDDGNSTNVNNPGSAGAVDGNTTVDIATLPAGEITQAVVNLLDNVDSVHIEEDMVIDITAEGINMNVTGNAKADISESLGMGHYFATVSTNGMSIEAEMYTENVGDNANIYIGSNGNWTQFNVSNVDMIKYTEEYVDIEHVKLFLNTLINVSSSSTTINGKSATLLEGEIDFSRLDEVIKALGFGDAFANGAISAEQIEQMYAGLSSPKMSVYIDNATGLPLQLDIDVVDFYESFFNNATNIMGNMNVTVNRANASIKFSNYNNVSISIPDEARNSDSMTDGSLQSIVTPNVYGAPDMSAYEAYIPDDLEINYEFLEGMQKSIFVN